MLQLVHAATLAAILALCSAATASDAGRIKDEALPCEDPNTLYIGFSSDIGRLDPAYVKDTQTSIITGNIYEGLLQINPAGFEFMPGLAESWEMSDDRKTCVFHLRKDVFFHDGTKFDAEAVRYNFERQMAGNALPEMMFAPEAFRPVESVEVLDEYTVRVNLKYPARAFLYNMARLTSTPIASPAALKQHHDDLSDNPVGTGPYRFVRRDGENTVILKRNDDYYMPNTGIENVVCTVISETYDRFLHLQQGKIDIMSGVDASLIKNIEESGNKIMVNPSLNTGYMVFNMSKSAQTADPDVRLAISAAVDVESKVSEVCGPYAKVATTFLPESIKGYNPNLTYQTYDPKLAKSVFERKNIKKLKIVTFEEARFFNSSGGAVLAEGIINDLKAVGVEAVVLVSPRRDFNNLLATEDWDICLTGWEGETGGALNMLWPMFSDNPQLNIGGWYDDNFRELLARAAETYSFMERDPMFMDAERIMAQELPILPLTHAQIMVAVNPGISGSFLHELARLNMMNVRKKGCSPEDLDQEPPEQSGRDEGKKVL